MVPRLVRTVGKVLFYTIAAAVSAVVFSPLILVMLLILIGLLACIAVLFGLALGLAAIPAAIFHSLFGLPFAFWMCLTGTGAVLMTIGMLATSFGESDQTPSPKVQTGSGLSPLLSLFLGFWLAGQMSERECGKG
ncbi:hypothetical protein ACP3TJ_09230 [Desulforudis sp. 1088]|uniref:hypothetical protein n=1 Tax=unclassified Candidatus Desulforudis TaxID=2635950 RepID=UPI003CE47433